MSAAATIPLCIPVKRGVNTKYVRAASLRREGVFIGDNLTLHFFAESPAAKLYAPRRLGEEDSHRGP